MDGSFRRCVRIRALRKVFVVAACGLMMTACASDPSYQTAAMKAYEDGDKKAAIDLAKKEVARFAKPEQCSRTVNLNCGTLALAYGTLANYQIMDGDRTAGEGSFRSAKGALSLTDPEIRSSATGIVYRDVSEAFWKAGDRERAVAVFNEGRAAGADKCTARPTVKGGRKAPMRPLIFRTATRTGQPILGQQKVPLPLADSLGC